MKLINFSLKNISNKNLFFLLIILSFLTEILYISLYYFPFSLNILYSKYILTITICFVYYFINIHIFDQLNQNNYNQSLLTFIFITGIIFRLTLIFLPPFLSDDIYRYIWDGYVQANNINPYLYSPSSEQLYLLHSSPIFHLLNHPHLPTIYPPLAQLAFLFAYTLTKHSIIGMKLILLISEILSAIFLVKTLNKLNIHSTNIAIYFWCPLPIVEFFINGHIDGIGILFFSLLIYSITSKQMKLSAIFLANSILVKILPIIFLFIILYKLNRKQIITFISVFFITLFLFYLPYLSAGEKVLGSLGSFIKDFYFNSSIFSLLNFLTGANHLAVLICYLLLALWIVVVTIRCSQTIDAIFWVLAGFYIFSPIVHPWYLTWIVPLLVLKRSKAFFWLIMSCQFSYYVLIEYHQNGIWQDSFIIRLIEYVPFFALLGRDLLRLQVKSKTNFQE